MELLFAADDPNELLPAKSYHTSQVDRPVVLHVTKTGPASDKPVLLSTAMREIVDNYGNQTALSELENLLFFLP